jgi:hypothetical protein
MSGRTAAPAVTAAPVSRCAGSMCQPNWATVPPTTSPDTAWVRPIMPATRPLHPAATVRNVSIRPGIRGRDTPRAGRRAVSPGR